MTKKIRVYEKLVGTLQKSISCIIGIGFIIFSAFLFQLDDTFLKVAAIFPLILGMVFIVLVRID